MYTINGQPTDLTNTDVMTIADAAKYLGVTGQSVAYYLDHAQLTTVLQPGKQTARRKPRRLTLRAEVEALKIKHATPRP